MLLCGLCRAGEGVKPPPFAYRRPTSVDEALELLAANPEAHLLAGGQSLIPLLNFRLLHPSMLVDLNGIAALSGIAATPDGATIGAMTRQAEAEQHPELARHWPLLTRALAHVGHVQTRNRGTIGGSLAHNDPAAELPAVLLALDASVEIRRREVVRRMPASAFFVTAMATALQPGELLVAVHLPRPPRGSGSGFAEFSRRHGDFALAAAAVIVSEAAAHARVVVTGTGSGPVRVAAAEQVLLAADFSPTAAAAVSGAVSTAVDPSGDLHAPAWYRRRVLGVMAARACRQAIAEMRR